MMPWLNRLFEKSNPSKFPTYWNDYVASCSKKIPANTPLDDLHFVVFDTETTGFGEGENHMLSLAYIEIDHGRINISKSEEFFLLDENTTGNDSIAVHGIMPKISKMGCKKEHVLQAFLKTISNKILVAHHAHYDVKVINDMITSLFPGSLQNKIIDTAQLAQRLERFGDPYHTTDYKRYMLDELCERYQVTIYDRHTAAGDTFATALLFLKLLQKAEKRGIKTYRYLMKKA